MKAKATHVLVALVGDYFTPCTNIEELFIVQWMEII
jgi:hypothetical protein